MSFTQWDPTALPVRPGLYINFVEAAVAQISGGAMGIVAIPLKAHTGGTATDKIFYTVTNESDATELFGADNIQSIKFALAGGASEVLVYTLPVIDGTTVTEEAAYSEARDGFEARPFNVFVFDGEVSATQQTETVAWLQTNITEKKEFMFVAGGSTADDLDPTVGNTRSTTLANDAVVNLISGVTIEGVDYSSSDYAPFIAGLVAGTPINASITYAVVPVDDVTKRLKNSDIVTALQAGSLVLVNDGEKVKVEQGLTTTKKKIRSIRARHAIATAIDKTARDNYIGKLNNNADGQAALISAVKAYLEQLENSNVLILSDNAVGLDPQHESSGDTVFLAINYTEVDSMEHVFLTVNV
jgi:hypothetical protein